MNLFVPGETQQRHTRVRRRKEKNQRERKRIREKDQREIRRESETQKNQSFAPAYRGPKANPSTPLGGTQLFIMASKYVCILCGAQFDDYLQHFMLNPQPLAEEKEMLTGRSVHFVSACFCSAKVTDCFSASGLKQY